MRGERLKSFHVSSFLSGKMSELEKRFERDIAEMLKLHMAYDSVIEGYTEVRMFLKQAIHISGVPDFLAPYFEKR